MIPPRKFSGYLIFSARGITGWKKGRPSLKSGEHAVRITLQVPDSDRDFPEAVISVPETAVIDPDVRIEDVQ